MVSDGEVDLSALWALASRRFALGAHSLHGLDHWQRVENNGRRIAAATDGADLLIVRLFAVLQDSRRMNESHDPEHGRRAADWAVELRRGGEHLAIDDSRFGLLCHACIWRDKGMVSEDPTIGVCWDADRLDLPRVGIRPASEFMSTPLGKKLARGDAA